MLSCLRTEEEVPVLALIVKSQEHGSSGAEALLSLAAWAVQLRAVLSCVSWSTPGQPMAGQRYLGQRQARK